MDKKESQKRVKEIVKQWIKNTVLSDEFKEVMKLADKHSHGLGFKIGRIIKVLFYIVGFIYMPRIVLLYVFYSIMKFLFKLALVIYEIEQEEGVKIFE